MTGLASKTLLEQEVELTRVVLGLRAGMDQHLVAKIMPHLDAAGSAIVRDLLDALNEEDGIPPNMAIHLDTAIVEVRKAIAAETTEEKVALPRELLIGCTEAFETRKVLGSTAKALQDALPPLERLYRATREATEFAEAVRASLRMLDRD